VSPPDVSPPDVPRPEPPRLSALLAARAAAAPEEPWLIFRAALDWGWRSWSQVADQVARIAASLTPEVGAEVRIARHLDADTIAYLLAVEACGACAVPAAGVAVRAQPVRSRLKRWQPVRIAVRDASAAGAPGGTEVPAERVNALDRALAAVRQRPIALACGSLADPGIRALLAWTLRAGAVLALEPDAGLAAQATVWIRPHLAVVPRACLDSVGTRVMAQKPRWRRLLMLASAEDLLPAALDRSFDR